MTRIWWVVRVTHRFETVSVTFVGLSPRTWFAELVAEFGSYAIIGQPKPLSLDRKA